MYRNLLAEMTRKGIKKQDIADAIGNALSTVWTKFNGVSNFTVSDAAKIRNSFFPDLAIEYLFEELFKEDENEELKRGKEKV